MKKWNRIEQKVYIPGHKITYTCEILVNYILKFPMFI